VAAAAANGRRGQLAVEAIEVAKLLAAS
jgi:hypothetical protein